MSSTIQIRQKIFCCSSPACAFPYACFCLLCPSGNCRAFCVNKPSVDDLLEILLVFDIELIHVFKNGIEGYCFASHKVPQYHNCCRSTKAFWWQGWPEVPSLTFVGISPFFLSFSPDIWTVSQNFLFSFASCHPSPCCISSCKTLWPISTFQSWYKLPRTNETSIAERITQVPVFKKRERNGW